MAKGNLQRCLDEVWPFEGKYTNDRRDPGNWTGGKVGVGELKGTNMGIAAASFPDLDIKNLTKAQAADIYAKRYARPLRFDDLRIGDDLAILDMGINSGISRSAKFTQSIVGTTQDGQIGPVTLAALEKMSSRDFIKKLCAKRLGFVQGLKIWETFGKGWSRRIAHMEATALSWVSSKSQLDQDAAAARNKAATQAGGAAVGVGGGVGVEQTPDVSGLPVWAIVVVVAVIAVPLIVRAVINAQRAAALASAAKAA